VGYNEGDNVGAYLYRHKINTRKKNYLCGDEYTIKRTEGADWTGYEEVSYRQTLSITVNYVT